MELRGFNNHLGSNTMVIYPEPFNANLGFDNSNGVDDYQMVEDLIADVASNYPIDVNDICIGGFSNGAIFTYNLVCDFNSPTSARAYQFRSFAIVSGAMGAGEANSTDCPIANTLPMIAFHGTQDPIIRYTGGAVPPPVNMMTEDIDNTIDFWATAINGCTATPTVTNLPDLVTETPAASTVELLEYSCTSAPNTQFYRINGGLHAWPGGNAALDMAQSRNMDIDASELIADFFENQTTVSIRNPQFDVDLSVYPNPTHDVISIQTAHALKQIEVFNAMGQTVLRSTAPQQVLSLAGLNPGSYLVKIETEAGTVVKRIIKN